MLLGKVQTPMAAGPMVLSQNRFLHLLLKQVPAKNVKVMRLRTKLKPSTLPFVQN